MGNDDTLAGFEMAANAALKRLLGVNDLYGNSAIRGAMMDEINGLIRYVRRTWTTEVSENTTKDLLQDSTPQQAR